MQVFISWSGESSRKIAHLIKEFLPMVLQATQPYFTPKDIDKGAKWLSDILKKLNECQVGIICVTPDNTTKPWLNFEAGALSNRSDSAIVCPLLFGIKDTNVKGPLSIFQATQFNREEFFALITSINKRLEGNKVPEKNLEAVFEAFYPNLEMGVNKILESDITAEDAKSVQRSQQDILEEILDLTRGLSKSHSKITRYSDALEYFVNDKKGFTSRVTSFEQAAINAKIRKMAKNNLKYYGGGDFEHIQPKFDPGFDFNMPTSPNDFVPAPPPPTFNTEAYQSVHDTPPQTNKSSAVPPSPIKSLQGDSVLPTVSKPSTNDNDGLPDK